MSARGYRVGSRYVTVPCIRGKSKHHRWDKDGNCLNCDRAYRAVTETRRHDRSGSGRQHRRKADNAVMVRAVPETGLPRCPVCWFDGLGPHRCETGWVL